MSPFSSIGIGEYYGNALAHNQGMAGVGISNPHFLFLNNQNPALLVFNRVTVFEAGFIGERRTVNANDVSHTNGDGNLNYLLLGFPVKSGKWSTSVGLAPYSTLNYRLNYTDVVEGSTSSTVDVSEANSGGINQLSWSNGLSITRNFSVGVKTMYLFSSLINEYTNTLTQSSQPVNYVPAVYERTYIRDINFSVGLSYRVDSLFKKNYKLNLGLVYDFKNNLKATYFSSIQRRNLIGDTIESRVVINDLPGAITLPQNLAAGISFGRGEKWMIGLDYTLLDYTQFRDFNGQQQGGTRGWRVALGTEFTPDPTALGSYLKRMTYRTGVSYDKVPYLLAGTQVKDFGINFGFTLPVNNSSLDLAFKVGKRGNLTDNTLEEDYFKIYFGVTFNDRWFIKKRFD